MNTDIPNDVRDAANKIIERLLESEAKDYARASESERQDHLLTHLVILSKWLTNQQSSSNFNEGSCPTCGPRQGDGVYEIGSGLWGACLIHRVKWHAAANSISLYDIEWSGSEW